MAQLTNGDCLLVFKTLRFLGKNVWSHTESSKSHLFACDYSPDGNTFVTAGKDMFVRLYDDETKQCISKMRENGYTIPGHINRVFCTKYSESDHNVIVTGGWDNSVYVYDIRS
jgi:COMPASS component SWD3